MRETVLLFNIKDKKRAQELQMICMSLRIRVRLIKKEEYFQKRQRQTGFMRVKSWQMR